MRAAVDVEHIMHANEELGLAPRGPGAASRPQPPTRQLWDDEVGSVLDLFRAPDVHGHSWYGQWCFVGSLDSFCVNVVQDMQAVAGGAAMRLRYAAISNGVHRPHSKCSKCDGWLVCPWGAALDQCGVLGEAGRGVSRCGLNVV